MPRPDDSIDALRRKVKQLERALSDARRYADLQTRAAERSREMCERAWRLGRWGGGRHAAEEGQSA